MKIKVRTIEYLIFLLLFLPFTKPSSLSLIAPQAEAVYNIGRAVSTVIVSALYFIKVLREKKIPSYLLFILLYFLSILFCTIINGSPIKILLNQTISTLSFCMLIEMAISRNCRIFFDAVYKIYFVLIIANFIIILRYPNGIAWDSYYFYPYTFLGIDNLLITIYLPVIAVVIIRSYLYKKFTAPSAVLLIITAATLIILWPATAMVGLIFLAVYFLVFTMNMQGIINSSVLFLIYPILTFLMLFFNLQNLFSDFIETILKKNISLTGRTEIWTLALDKISRSPVLGYGAYQLGGHIYWHGKMFHAHNSILEVLLQGGVFALLAHALLLAVIGKVLYNNKNDRTAKLMTGIMTSFLIMMTVEAYVNNIWFYGAVTIAFCVPKIIEQTKKDTRSCSNERPDLNNNPRLQG